MFGPFWAVEAVGKNFFNSGMVSCFLGFSHQFLLLFIQDYHCWKLLLQSCIYVDENLLPYVLVCSSKTFFFLFSGRQTRWSRSRSSPPSHNLLRTCSYGSQPKAYIASQSQPTPHLQVRKWCFFYMWNFADSLFQELSSVLLRIWRRNCGWWFDFRWSWTELFFKRKTSNWTM